jgi:hypothetical protein
MYLLIIIIIKGCRFVEHFFLSFIYFSIQQAANNVSINREISLNQEKNICLRLS